MESMYYVGLDIHKKVIAICVKNKDPVAALMEAAEQRIRVDGSGSILPVSAD